MTSRRVGAALLVAALSLTFAVPAQAGFGPGWFWNVPHCDTVYGDGSVTITTSDGAVLAPTKSQLRPVTYAKVAVLQQPNTLIAIGKQSIQRSSDAGCSWQQIDKSPDYLRGVAGDGQVFDSADDGLSWKRVGQPVARDLFVYNAVIDPKNPSHIVIGVMSDGGYATFDGGRTWARSKAVERVNAFSLAISPVNPSVVWLEGYDRDEATRYIWQSDDGGLKFRPVLDSSQATLYNGNKMWPSPVDADLLYFAYGTSFANYGSDLYRFRPSTGELSKQHNKHDGIPGLAFNPADPSVLYLGLAEEH
jgi:photosystem II stability/assembly factor-like uncharacterized protein